MGSGGGYFPTERTVDDLRHEAVAATQGAELEGAINEFLHTVLASINERDVKTIRQRLDRIKSVVADVSDDTIDTLFGGSVAKHTYVNGLSDVDALLILSSETIRTERPAEVRKELLRALRERLPSGVRVREGSLAVTVTFSDGPEIQLLPAVKLEGRFAIASPDGGHWAEIDPSGFAKKLSSENERLNGTLVRTIKLTKAILDNFLPRDQQPSGYHVESLAIDIFKGYKGPRTPKAMLSHFFDHAPDHVLQPIQDSSGQSVHVDGDLGEPGSLARRLLANSLGRISRRMKYAAALEDWASLFDVGGVRTV